MFNTIKAIAKSKHTDTPFIVRNLVNKGLNKAITKALKYKETLVLYKGISLLDNETPIMIVMSGFTKDSSNVKTGGLVQLYILPVHETPKDTYFGTYKKGGIVPSRLSVCGDCKYNGNNGCYVRWATLGSIWKAAKDQPAIPTTLTREFLKGLRVRVGAAGDPAAVPASVWNKILGSCENFTGYTHQWNKPQFQNLQDLFVASVDNARENEKARALGWSTFFVTDNEEEAKNEGIRCLASAGKSDTHGLPTTCATCMLCNGQSRKQKTITEVLHGATNTQHKARIARTA
tara:strand:+ start:9498 stop:10364 length:867 start_codon:yes stop_codon:yes gene_type:complete